MHKQTPLSTDRKAEFATEARPRRFEMTVVPWWVVDSIHRIVQYKWTDERRDFLNSPENGESMNHIFCDLEIVQTWLEAPPEKVVPAPVFWSAAAVTFCLLAFFLPELLFAFGVLDEFGGCQR